MIEFLKLFIHSPQLMGELGCFRKREEECEEFVKYFAGDVDGAFASYADDHHHRVDLNTVRTWATPYALSIMGNTYD
jgi:hypothetical protein